MSEQPHQQDSQVPAPRMQLAAFVFLALVLTATFLAYRQGLPGQFMFDDYPNLQTLSNYGGVEDLTRLKLYLDDAFAGPTGRPISMLSFLIDVHEWPADPGAIKFKNVLIHLLNGLILVWLLTASLRQSYLARRPGEVLWIAGLAAAWWILHPLHVSTVLYAIQRMAELSTLFVLLGLAGYVLGRHRLRSHPLQGYALMVAALGIGTVLATFSKENGALLPLLALVLEGCILASGTAPRPSRLFRIAVLWAPSAALIGYTAYKGASVGVVTEHIRGFTALERLATECRIVFDYLFNLFLPRPNTGGIFRDSMTVSESLLSPTSTLFAVIGVVALIGGAVALRRRLPLVSAAILFFFAGHLLESTVIPLELYFEHRNYLPSALLFLPIAQFLVWIWRSTPKAALPGAALITLALAGTLFARAELWSDRTNLYLIWANDNANSPRAQLSAANVLQQSGNTEAALDRLEHAIESNPKSLALHAHAVRFTAQTSGVSNQRVQEMLAVAGEADFTNEALVAVRRLTDDALSGEGGGIDPGHLLSLWRSLERNPAYGRASNTQALISHQLGRLHANLGHREQAVRYFEDALYEGQEVQTAIMQAAVLATNEFYCAGLSQLDEAERLLAQGPAGQLNRDYFDSEVTRLRRIMEGEAKTAGAGCS